MSESRPYRARSCSTLKAISTQAWLYEMLLHDFPNGSEMYRQFDAAGWPLQLFFGSTASGSPAMFSSTPRRTDCRQGDWKRHLQLIVCRQNCRRTRDCAAAPRFPRPKNRKKGPPRLVRHGTAGGHALPKNERDPSACSAVGGSPAQRIPQPFSLPAVTRLWAPARCEPLVLVVTADAFIPRLRFEADGHFPPRPPPRRVPPIPGAVLNVHCCRSRRRPPLWASSTLPHRGSFHHLQLRWAAASSFLPSVPLCLRGADAGCSWPAGVSAATLPSQGLGTRRPCCVGVTVVAYVCSRRVAPVTRHGRCGKDGVVPPASAVVPFLGR